MLKGNSEDEMAIWPFGRKSKKKPDSNHQMMAASRNKHAERTRGETGSVSTDNNSPTLTRKLSRKESLRRQRGSSKKLTKAPHSRIRDPEKSEPLPSTPTNTQPTSDRQTRTNEKTEQLSSPPQDRGDVPSYYFQNPTSLSSLQPENFNVIPFPPTLRAKRGANDSSLPRRKSSKRKADDHAREQEVKAMSSSSPMPIPKRPTSHTSGILARDKKTVSGGLGHKLERPLSNVSSPLPESLHSTVSVVSDSHGFKVSAFDVLSPRPTIRHFDNSRNQDLGSGSFGPSRTSMRKDRQPVIPEEAIKSKKRIDDLADGLDAHRIKELMDRDRRRSERNRKSDQEKLQRRLQRKADKQHAADKSGLDLNDGLLKENIDPRAAGQDDVGLGIAKAATAPVLVSPSFRDENTKPPESWMKDSAKDGYGFEDPFKDVLGGSVTSPADAPSPTDDPDEPVLETAKAVRLSQASMSPPTSPHPQFHGHSSLSQLSDPGSRSTLDIPERLDPDRRDSDSSRRLSNNWTSIFRRSGTRANRNSSDRGRAPPSEFSNTSRESFARQMPPSAFARIPPARSGTPIRTQSRFREDLPELPTSPSDSRLQSPETSTPTPGAQPEGLNTGTPIAAGAIPSPSQPLSDIHPAFREQVALSRHHSLKSPTPEIPSSAVLSQSLASVDSEGSWLTGRPVKRSSQSLANPLRGSAGSLQQDFRGLGASEDEQDLEIGAPHGREKDLTHGQGKMKPQVNIAPGLGSESDEDQVFDSQPPMLPQDEGKWHGSLGKQPMIVRQGARAKSREGLLNEFQSAEDSAESSPSGDSPIGQPFGDQITQPENSLIYRATSVDLGKGHARHISAGSARLLNLPPRSSVEMKRISTSSGERSPLGAILPHENEEIRASEVD